MILISLSKNGPYKLKTPFWLRQGDIIVKNQHISLGQELETVRRELGTVRKPMERKTAFQLGLRKYFTGRPCRHGHMSERYTLSGGCIECLTNYQSRIKECSTKAQELLMKGRLSKQQAIELGSAYYCEGWGLQCGHVSWQLVRDDSCKMCTDKLALELLS
jgi:hypothetical protein